MNRVVPSLKTLSSASFVVGTSKSSAASPVALLSEQSVKYGTEAEVKEYLEDYLLPYRGIEPAKVMFDLEKIDTGEGLCVKADPFSPEDDPFP